MKKLLNAIKGFFPILIITGGILGLLYPTISNYLNEKNSSRVVENYDTAVRELAEEKKEQALQAAREYNEALLSRNGFEKPYVDKEGSYVPMENYENLLNVYGDGMMGYLTLPKLKETVPIYHGASEKVLQSGIGHLENTSLPIGGASTHAALSGHRGLTSKQMFTDLDQMEIGDVFYIDVMGDKLAYQTDRILTVLPSEMDSLAIEEGEDLVTLITCTPYGINSHRLLVRGSRIPYEEAVKISTDNGGPFVTQTHKELIIGIYVLIAFFVARLIISVMKDTARRNKR